jgi:aminomethyltransferase
MNARKTPLYELHEKLGARMIDFHGWMMPVQYKGVIEEHNAVRKKAGLFDVSHMGEVLVFGSNATEFVNHSITNDVNRMADGQCLYTPMCYENGTIVDDLLVYKHNSEHYMLVVNASNSEKDFKWIESRMRDFMAEDESEIGLRNVSESTAMLALQGPKSGGMLQKLTDVDLKQIKRLRFRDNVMLGEVKALVSRTGYTGEDGFEIYMNAGECVEVWEGLIDAGGRVLQPVGLGARDTLRLEAGLMLYGNDIDESTTPMEAAIGWTVKFDKKEFIGRDELLRQKADGVEKRMAGFELIEKGVPRHGHKIALDSGEIGYVTSGTFSPTLGKSIGLCYVKPEYSSMGVIFDVMIRDRPIKARVVEIPFYRR